MSLALNMRGISKSFPGVLANDDITLDVRMGEIHALLGENGAGKTTLMNILYGIHQPDEGEIAVFGQSTKIRSPRDAIDLGIGMVHQHFMLVDGLTVIENIVLGWKTGTWPFLNVQDARKKVKKLSDRFGFPIELDAQVADLPVGMQQRVEIIKSLFREARLLILDEPTSVLTPKETKELILILKRLSQEGLSIVFISHKLEEVMSLCDRVTVLRNGRVVSTVETQEVDKVTLARKMVGREIITRTSSSVPVSNKVLLDVESLRFYNERGLLVLKDVSFKIHEGEIFGIAGVDGNGQTELAEALSGLKEKLANGKIILQEMDIGHFSAKQRMESGIGYIPENRQKKGLVMNFCVWENLVLKECSTSKFSYWGLWFRSGKIKSSTQIMIDLFDIRGPSKETPVKNLSGGNQQKIVLAREFDLQPELLIAAQPTRGLDVGAIEFVHGQILDFAKQGHGVLLISTELEEILSLSHRFAVIYEGEFVAIMDNTGQIDLGDVGLMMAGSKHK